MGSERGLSSVVHSPNAERLPYGPVSPGKRLNKRSALGASGPDAHHDPE